MHRDTVHPPAPRWPELKTAALDLHQAGLRVLAHPAVASKSFLVTIGDRSVGGLTAREQMVGPWQLPLADCAITLAGFETFAGEAMSIGERTPLALLDAAASARMAVGEAITNCAPRRCHRWTASSFPPTGWPRPTTLARTRCCSTRSAQWPWICARNWS